ncbi:tryptophan--tRNA ligase [Candidatus Dependentiae bacterium]|nr:tryptophan--tRNA ligase [Candidatus Dependentiae bacterium]
MNEISKDKIVLTGDRPTGPLHLGHYVGSLENRLILQNKYKQYVMVADVQALTDNAARPELKQNVLEVVLDYLSVGIDPAKSTIFIQSMIPQIAELTIFYLNLVTVNRLRRNPTVKTEILQKGFGENVPAGFLIYPVSQAADITFINANLVPVGEDQLPMIEQTNEIVRSFNRIYNTNVLVEAQALVPKMARLPGIDGKAKMSKSLGNAIYLKDDQDTIFKKVKEMYTDPGHIRVSDPGKVEGNVVFSYLDVFDHDKVEVENLKEQYKKGGLGDMVLKKRLAEVLNNFLNPLREKRKELEKNPDYVIKVLKEGTEKTLDAAQKNFKEIKKAMQLNYF